jgi:phosphatidylethanolamine/phosphatidyl-N-methylethanolamine N-methyltransferase
MPKSIEPGHLDATARFYDRISFLYPAINQFLKRQRKMLIHEVNSATPGKLLEIGVGNGSHLPLYRHHQVTAIDISESMLEKAKRMNCVHVSLQLMDGEELLFSNDHFDYVVISHVLAVTKEPDQMIDQVFKVLKPGGRLYILNHFTPASWLRFVDMAFQPFSSLFHFRSVFYQHQVKSLDKFTLLKQKDLGVGAYFKLLIFCKP